MLFPFWSKSLDPPNVMFERLKNQDLIITEDQFNNKVIERSYPKDYLLIDHLSNHFTEYERINCQFGNFSTPAEVWCNIKKDKDIKKMSHLEQRELVYSKTRECNTFNVTFCLWLINSLVGPNANILDPSSGWGDRLIASLASNAKLYHGFDPNKKLQKGYKKIIKTLNITTDVVIKCAPFEDAKLLNIYDIAITSPPYFDLEKYGTDPKQSIIKYPTYTEWLEFYNQYIIKMINAVVSNGYIIIYIEDVVNNGTKYDLRKFTINTVNSSKLIKNHTRMGLKVGKAIRYALIWQKI